MRNRLNPATLSQALVAFSVLFDPFKYVVAGQTG
jgi:hypothetical protein